MRIRPIVYSIAAAAMVLSLLAASAQLRVDAVWVLIVLAGPLSVLAGWRRPRRRPLWLAIGAGFLAVWTPGTPVLWLSVGALVFFSIAEDPQQRPWLGWLLGLTGATISSIAYDRPAVASVLATAVGGGGALLLRSWSRTVELTGEADTLRGQAAWLEQRTAVARAPRRRRSSRDRHGRPGRGRPAR